MKYVKRENRREISGLELENSIVWGRAYPKTNILSSFQNHFISVS